MISVTYKSYSHSVQTHCPEPEGGGTKIIFIYLIFIHGSSYGAGLSDRHSIDN